MDVLLYTLLGGALALCAVIALGRRYGFTAQSPEDYGDRGPVFDIRERLNGPIHCEGVIYGPFGRVTSRFVAHFEASWDGNTGVMTEAFHYDSGAVQNRRWTLTVQEGGTIAAEAPDLVGTGRGRQHGSAVKLSYALQLTPEAGGHVLKVTDWMYLVENGVIVNRSQFRKFGIKVGELVATMRPAAMDIKAAA